MNVDENKQINWIKDQGISWATVILSSGVLATLSGQSGSLVHGVFDTTNTILRNISLAGHTCVFLIAATAIVSTIIHHSGHKNNFLKIIPIILILGLATLSEALLDRYTWSHENSQSVSQYLFRYREYYIPVISVLFIYFSFRKKWRWIARLTITLVLAKASIKNRILIRKAISAKLLIGSISFVAVILARLAYLEYHATALPFALDYVQNIETNYKINKGHIEFKAEIKGLLYPKICHYYVAPKDFTPDTTPKKIPKKKFLVNYMGLILHPESIQCLKYTTPVEANTSSKSYKIKATLPLPSQRGQHFLLCEILTGRLDVPVRNQDGNYQVWAAGSKWCSEPFLVTIARNSE